MTALLKELSNQEIDWLIDNGNFRDVAADTVLVEANQPSNFYISLEGDLSALFVQPKSDNSWEYRRLSSGELFGTMPWLDPVPSPTKIKALTNCTVLEIPLPQLAEKSVHDAAFTARLCRANATQMLDHLSDQFNPQLSSSTGMAIQSQFRDALTVFAELQDSDLDWMLAVGQVQSLAANTVLARQGRPFDALHIVLEGALTLNRTESNSSGDLRAAFSIAQEGAEAEIARLSRGEMVGEMAFVNSSLSAFTIKANRESQIFSIPQWRLAAKLLHDVQFAARFYRVLAMLIASKQQTMMQRYFTGNTSVNGVSDSQFLARVELAEARFEWMQMRIQTQFGMERQLQW